MDYNPRRTDRAVPEQGWDRASTLARRDTVLIFLPDEGWIAEAVLTVRVVPGTAGDQAATREAMLEELEVHVDHGGSILGY